MTSSCAIDRLLKRSLKLNTAILFLLVMLSGCSLTSNNLDPSSTRSLGDGMMMIARPLPAVTAVSPGKLLAFMPLPEPEGPWLKINRASSLIQLIEADQILASAKGDNFQSLPSGRFEVVHKQRRAPWHASSDYFNARKLAVPPSGASTRFLRGALGEFAIFLTKDLPVHSGPVSSPEIGGAKVAEKELSRIYYQIDVGTTVTIE